LFRLFSTFKDIMGELRKDYFSDRWIVIAPERQKRNPAYMKDFGKNKGKYPEVDKDCPFCPGNEHRAEPETLRIEKDGNWQVRAFLNAFPALKEDRNWKVKNDELTGGPAYGRQEVIVETPRHDLQMEDLSVEELATVLEICAKRQKEMLEIEGIRYVVLFKNKGGEAGSSVLHSHLQIAAIPVEAKWIMDEANEEANYRESNGKCGYCEVREREMKTERAIAENEHFACFTPWAPRWGYEVWFVPKRHVGSLFDLDKNELVGFAKLLKNVLLRIKVTGVDYNLLFHSSPKEKDLHFHVHLAPRFERWGGFEMTSGMVFNPYPPEEAAKFFRGDEN